MLFHSSVLITLFSFITLIFVIAITITFTIISIIVIIITIVIIKSLLLIYLLTVWGQVKFPKYVCLVTQLG